MTYRPPIPVTVVNLETGERRRFSSCQYASRVIEVSSTKLLEMVKSGSIYRNWYVFATGKTPDVEAKIRAKTEFYRMNGPTTRKGGRKTNGGLVSLRIDAKTVIMVTPDKATDEYAEQWRQRHDRDSRHSRPNHEFIEKNDIIKYERHKKQ